MLRYVMLSLSRRADKIVSDTLVAKQESKKKKWKKAQQD